MIVTFSLFFLFPHTNKVARFSSTGRAMPPVSSKHAAARKAQMSTAVVAQRASRSPGQPGRVTSFEEMLRLKNESGTWERTRNPRHALALLGLVRSPCSSGQGSPRTPQVAARSCPRV